MAWGSLRQGRKNEKDEIETMVLPFRRDRI